MVTRSKKVKKENQEMVGELCATNSVCVRTYVCLCVCVCVCVKSKSVLLSPTALAFSLGVITGGVVSAALLLALKRGR